MYAKILEEQMMREIQRLQTKAEDLEKETDSLRHIKKWGEQILSSLEHDERCNEIISGLERRESYRVIAERLGRSLG